jgi:hypothetical protein
MHGLVSKIFHCMLQVRSRILSRTGVKADQNAARNSLNRRFGPKPVHKQSNDAQFVLPHTCILWIPEAIPKPVARLLNTKCNLTGTADHVANRSKHIQIKSC